MEEATTGGTVVGARVGKGWKTRVGIYEAEEGPAKPRCAGPAVDPCWCWQRVKGMLYDWMTSRSAGCTCSTQLLDDKGRIRHGGCDWRAGAGWLETKRTYSAKGDREQHHNRQLRRRSLTAQALSGSFWFCIH